jgi:AbrB family looped-hinge helix DNA binding protein
METHVTAKGQVVIPVALRRKYGITAGTKVHIYEENDRIILQPVTRETIRKVRGMFKGAGALKALVADRKREKEL